MKKTGLVKRYIDAFKSNYSSISTYHEEVRILSQHSLRQEPLHGFYVACCLDNKYPYYLLDWPTVSFDKSMDSYRKGVDLIGEDLYEFGEITQVSWFIGGWSLQVCPDGTLYDKRIENSIRDRLNHGFFPEVEYCGVDLWIPPIVSDSANNDLYNSKTVLIEHI